MLRSKLLVLILFLACGAQASPILSAEQAKNFRAWMVLILEDQISRGANPRWNHRDCAGLVRFAVHESFVLHTPEWRKANGFLGRPLPPEIELSPASRAEFKTWKISSSERSHFVRAMPLIQQNTVFIGKSIDYIQAGDLLFFDQGDEQHLMIWTGRRIVYHNGARPVGKQNSKDNGLRTASLQQLMNWKDTRWQPRPNNPNFIGFYRFSFLNASPSFSQENL